MAVVGHFSILDRKGAQFFPVFTAKNVDVARRSVVQSLTPENVLVQYPRDYTLVHVADFNDETGEIIALDGSCVHECGQLVDLIPDTLRQYALDGSFKDLTDDCKPF